MDPLQQQQIPPPPPPPPPIPANAQQAQPQQPTSMLERLREQVARELMPDETSEMQRRARTFGAALMGSRGNFFEGLAAGQQALEQQRGQDQQARVARMQQLEQQAQRQAELDLRQAEFEYSRDPANPTNQLRLAQARQAAAEIARGSRPTFIQGTDAAGNLVAFDPATGRRVETGMRPLQELRNQPRPLSPADRARLRQAAARQALQEIPAIVDTPEIIARRREREDTLFDEALQAATTGTAPAGPAGASGAPASQPAPTRVIPYAGPQPTPAQQ